MHLILLISQKYLFQVFLCSALMLTVNSWETVAPFLKKTQIVKPSPKIWIGEKVYVLQSIVQHHGISKGTQKIIINSRIIIYIFPASRLLAPNQIRCCT